MYIMKPTTADGVISKLNSAFTPFGLPDSIKTDNGPPFDSRHLENILDGKEFSTTNYTFVTSRNTKCERFVRVIEKILKAAKIEGNLWKSELYKLLLSYKNSLHTSRPVSVCLCYSSTKI